MGKTSDYILPLGILAALAIGGYYLLSKVGGIFKPISDTVTGAASALTDAAEDTGQALVDVVKKPGNALVDIINQEPTTTEDLTRVTEEATGLADVGNVLLNPVESVANLYDVVLTGAQNALFGEKGVDPQADMPTYSSNVGIPTSDLLQHTPSGFSTRGELSRVAEAVPDTAPLADIIKSKIKAGKFY